MAVAKEKKDFEKQAGRAKASRRGGKYVIEIGDKSLVLDSSEDLMYLSAAIQQVMDEEWKELQEYRRSIGLKTSVRYVGDQVVEEY
jgi:hypothetical protein